MLKDLNKRSSNKSASIEGSLFSHNTKLDVICQRTIEIENHELARGKIQARVGKIKS